VSVKVAFAAIKEYEHLGRTAEKFHETVARQLLRWITARPAISLTGLGLVSLAGLYSLGVTGMPNTELMSHGETKAVVSTDVRQNRDATVNPAPRVSTGSDTDALQNVGTVERALIQPLSPANDSEASKRAGGTVSSTPRSIPRTSVANPGRNTQPKSRDATAYSVKSGDTIERIAHRHFGSEVNIQSVIKANPQLRNVNRIYPGDTVFLPVESTRRGEN
jgi:LysM repeat protein